MTIVMDFSGLSKENQYVHVLDESAKLHSCPLLFDDTINVLKNFLWATVVFECMLFLPNCKSVFVAKNRFNHKYTQIAANISENGNI